KMSVTSVEAPAACGFGGRGFKSRPAFHAPVAQSTQRRPFPANQFTIRGEDRCYFVENDLPAHAGRGFSNRLFPDRVPHAGGEECCCLVARPLSCRTVGGSLPSGHVTPQLSSSVRVVCAPKGVQSSSVPWRPYTIRGEDRCYFVSKTRGRGFESRPAFRAPVAQRIERFPAHR